jgi:hypothetical protein
MSATIISLLAVIYLLSVGFWSMFLIYGGHELGRSFYNKMTYCMFVPAINTLLSVFIILSSWGKLMSGAGPDNNEPNANGRV